MTTHTPGPRQTVARAKHPTLGEGRAVYENGPAFFLPDNGEPVALRKVGLGGSRTGPPRYSYLVAHTLTGERIELETTGRPGGEHHYRRWHPTHGEGWYVGGAKTGHDRWESDAGPTIPLVWSELKVGRPGKKGKTKADKAEDDQWWTVVLTSGEVFCYRSAPPFATTEEAPTPQPVTQGAVSLTQAIHAVTPRVGSPKFPPPNATRAEIDAWVKSQTATA